ncbi:DUF2911 domain-containing protein [Mucilaginibacter ginkgonis]|uniref:DUF2911 domain-containing protein n=1 Tax=Mucilaginibacter ginkgonis TaxID=2682091 RepID=A0A6I4I2E2_9SPHI|nr:DUF2911 domain-containing protein [Mucilaginibacter ginkgonis]QQL49213.1 DUF2911 domain-containing protein [Mucilaginibacter ginkgonis]
MKNLKFKAVFSFLALMLVYLGVSAQPMDRKSPHETVKGTIGSANVTIVYGSPRVKGRTIFGGLEAWDKAWRAGADEATTFETDKDLMVQGQKLPAGKYSLFFTPSQGEWTVTFNSQVGQWGIKRTGEANFDAAKNVVVAKVKAKKTPLTENLTYAFTPTGFALNWENVSVPVMVK